MSSIISESNKIFNSRAIIVVIIHPKRTHPFNVMSSNFTTKLNSMKLHQASNSLQKYRHEIMTILQANLQVSRRNF